MNKENLTQPIYLCQIRILYKKLGCFIKRKMCVLINIEDLT
jgi:hypothetical protein